MPAAVRAGHDPCVAESQAPDVLPVGWTRPYLRTSPMPSRSRSSPSRPGPPVPTPARLRSLLTAHRRLITADAIQAGILRVEHYGKMGWNNAACALRPLCGPVFQPGDQA
jgi:hypothetical protein